MVFFTKGTFWQATIERTVKTFAETLAATLTANATGLIDVDWKASLSVAGFASLLAVLFSLGSGAVSTGNNGPSLTGAEEIPADQPPEPPAAPVTTPSPAAEPPPDSIDPPPDSPRRRRGRATSPP